MPYALPKLDMIAIPDFAAGAMENYGLVTYRETALLYDEQHSAAANKQRVMFVNYVGVFIRLFYPASEKMFDNTTWFLLRLQLWWPMNWHTSGLVIL